MNDSLPLLFAVSTMGNRKNLNLKRFPKENFLSPKGCKEGNSLGTLAKEQASIGWIPRYIASVFLVSPLDLGSISAVSRVRSWSVSRVRSWVRAHFPEQRLVIEPTLDLSAAMLILMLTSLPHISVDNRAGMGRRKTNVPCLCWERLWHVNNNYYIS